MAIKRFIQVEKKIMAEVFQGFIYFGTPDLATPWLAIKREALVKHQQLAARECGGFLGFS